MKEDIPEYLSRKVIHVTKVNGIMNVNKKKFKRPIIILSYR